ncbi:MAG TPA: AAA family ATPase [Gemmataceae bacterium]|jgi:hypothetical protein|nr:AAA family ATPase [Gemmataceae bacterium]
MSNTHVANAEFLKSCEVAARARQRDDERWLWHGFLAAANLTLLVGQWKAGKTTLLSVLLARLAQGGTLAGLAVRAGRAIVVSEEADDLWADRVDHLRLGDELTIVSRPFRGRPSSQQWQALIDQLVDRHAADPFNLLVIDPLAAFVPGRSENDAGAMLDVLLPLQELTRLGVAILVLHHPSKKATAAGRLARGSGAVTGSVDIIIELELMASAAEDDRRRKLSAYSRHRATQRRLIVELTPDGTDYVALGDYIGNDFEDNWPVLAGVLEDASGKLTRKEVHKYWPQDFVKPSPMAIWRWLDQAVKQNRVLMSGNGRRNHPFVYWLDGMEDVWRSDPFHLPVELPDLYGPRKTLAEAKAERAEQEERQAQRAARRSAKKANDAGQRA